MAPNKKSGRSSKQKKKSKNNCICVLCSETQRHGCGSKERREKAEWNNFNTRGKI